MIKAYIATKLENHAKHNKIMNEIAKLGVRLTYDWTLHGAVYAEGAKRIQEVSELELMGVLQADFVVVILPGGRGTHVELGMALAANKTVYLLCETRELQDMVMIPTKDTCAFYHNIRCIKVYGIEHLLSYVKEEIRLYELRKPIF